MRSLAILVLVFCFVALVCVASRVLIPYYHRQHDEPVATESRQQVSAIMRAINQFVEQNPDRRFPTNLTEVASLTVSDTHKFVYLPPPAHASPKELFGRVVLIEKLGHYKYKDGGYYGVAGDAIARWYSRREFETLAEKNGLSIEQLSEPRKQLTMATATRPYKSL